MLKKNGAPPATKSPYAVGFVLLLLTALLYTLTNYGGIRAADSEIVFRLSESIATEGKLDVKELELWPGFGVSPGKDQKKYPVFGPAESFLNVPFYLLARTINKTGWYNNLSYLPPSHYCTDGIFSFVRNRTPRQPEQHALRFIVSFFNVLVSTLTVSVFWLIMWSLLRHTFSAFAAASVFAFGTLLWPYSGTFFSEPLATLFVLLSFYLLVIRERAVSASAQEKTALNAPGNPGKDDQKDKNKIKVSFLRKLLRQINNKFLWAGIFLGVAIAAHLTAVLFVPFFMIYGFFLAKHKGRLRRSDIASGGQNPFEKGFWTPKTFDERSVSPNHETPLTGSTSRGVKALLIFSAGLGIILPALAFYNFYRFGNFLETGRLVDAAAGKQFYYGHFVFSLRNLYGLLLSSGKGLLLYSPAVFLGIFGWYVFHKQKRLLSYIILAMVVFRILFIAGRSDWHGGFCLGPRYLIMIIPFLMIPFGFGLKELLSRKKIRAVVLLGIFAFFCVAQQVYFCTGEIFTYYQAVKLKSAASSIDIFKNDRIYFDRDVSPLYHLLEGKRGPFLFQGVELSNAGLCLLLILLTALILTVFYFVLFYRKRRRENNVTGSER